jgi:hypothetical protein
VIAVIGKPQPKALAADLRRRTQIGGEEKQQKACHSEQSEESAFLMTAMAGVMTAISP